MVFGKEKYVGTGEWEGLLYRPVKALRTRQHRLESRQKRHWLLSGGRCHHKARIRS
jgi:hypothetical protein